MFKNYLLTAIRKLFRDRSTSFLNILGLSTGMTAAILIFIWVQNELSYDNYHPDVDRIYRVTSYVNANQWRWASAPFPLAATAKEQLPAIEASTTLIAANNPAPVFRINGELITQKSAAYVDTNWFRIFHYD